MLAQELRVDLAAVAGLMPARAVRTLLGKVILVALVLLPLVRLWVVVVVVPALWAETVFLQKAEMAAKAPYLYQQLTVVAEAEAVLTQY
jgi:hypothetical protein